MWMITLSGSMVRKVYQVSEEDRSSGPARIICNKCGILVLFGGS